MSELILPWVVLALLLVLCLPVRGFRKLILEAAAWSLRLALLALLGAAAYLWFRPGDLPADLAGGLDGFPRLRAALPDPTSPAFATCLIAPVVAALLPVLAALDVTRKLAGRLRVVASADAATPTAAPPRPAEPAADMPFATELVEDQPVGAPRPVDRRAAAAAIAAAGAQRPARAPGRQQP